MANPPSAAILLAMEPLRSDLSVGSGVEGDSGTAGPSMITEGSAAGGAAAAATTGVAAIN